LLYSPTPDLYGVFPTPAANLEESEKESKKEETEISKLDLEKVLKKKKKKPKVD